MKLFLTCLIIFSLYLTFAMFYQSVPVVQLQSPMFFVLMPSQNYSGAQVSKEMAQGIGITQNQTFSSTNSSDPQPVKRGTDAEVKIEHEDKCQDEVEAQNGDGRREDEEQFLPNKPHSSKRRRNSQNANRNVIPNIIHKVISFMLKKIRSGKLVDILLDKLLPPLKASNPSEMEKCSIDRYYRYLTSIKNKINNYVNQDSLLVIGEYQDPTFSVYSKPEQQLYIKICRMLILYFLEQQYDLTILTSKRMKPEKKLAHIEAKRKLVENLPQLFSNTLLHQTQ